MKQILALTLLALAPSLAVAGCATSRTMGEQADDSMIDSRLAAKLAADPDIRKYQVDVDTLDRVVTLTGTVESERDRQEVEQIAYDTEGVQKVVNRISVGDDPNPELFDDDLDGWITTKVKSVFAADPDIRAFDIDVDTEEGVVRLSGETSDEAAIQEAEQKAREIEGVKDVQNELTVSEAAEKSQGEEDKILEGEEDSLFESKDKGEDDQDSLFGEEKGEDDSLFDDDASKK